jgi:hypothetical protein
LLEQAPINTTPQVLDKPAEDVAVELAQTAPRIHSYSAHNFSSIT